jgi:hypothetical protein
MGNNTIKAGNIEKSIVIAGDKNRAKIAVEQAPLRDPSKVCIVDELAGLRSALSNLNSTGAAKMSRALDDADDEIKKDTPDKDEVGSAVERALKVAKEASDFADNTSKLLPFVTGIAAWLGANWAQLLSML